MVDPGTAVLCVAVGVGISLFLRYRGKSPEELLISYMDCISAGKYEKMYEMIDAKASGNISLEDFTRRNQAIYEGIEMQDMKISEIDCSEKEKTVKYTASFDTAAGKVSFENEASFTRGERRMPAGVGGLSDFSGTGRQGSGKCCCDPGRERRNLGPERHGAGGKGPGIVCGDRAGET